MTADQLVQRLSEGLFVALFLITAYRAARRPLRTNIDIALLFAAPALAVAETWIAQALGILQSPLAVAVTGVLILALPYLLVRLLDDFAVVSRWTVRASEAALVLSTIVLLATSEPRPVWVTLILVLHFTVFTGYASIQFVRTAQRSAGVTRRRMQSVAAGSVFIALAVLVAGLQLVLPDLLDLWSVLGRASGLASGLSYFAGFAPPSWLRRAWQEPELRGFLARAARLPRLPNTASIVRELEHGAANSVGAPGASIRLWDEANQLLVFDGPTGRFEQKPGEFIAGRAFTSQRPLLTIDAGKDDPANADLYSQFEARAILAAPITAGSTRLGVLTVFAPRAPVFADDDLGLVHLLANQAAVILESRALIDAATRLRAREEATRLKDDFLSSAAHDLKTPLTTLIAQAQLLERRAERRPEEPADLAGLRRVVSEARRLNRLVLEFLDAAGLEQGRLIRSRESVDLTVLASEVCSGDTRYTERCALEAEEPVVGEFDPLRVRQVLEHLLENAAMYSPAGGQIQVRVWRDGSLARVKVADRGIGIPAEDLPFVFDRFHRGSNVDDRRFAGMGLGLYICRGIVEQHGGRIWASSSPQQGTTLELELPIKAKDFAEPVPEPLSADARAAMVLATE